MLHRIILKDHPVILGTLGYMVVPHEYAYHERERASLPDSINRQPMGFKFLDTLEKEHEGVQNRLARMEENLKETMPNAGDPFEQLKLKLISQIRSEEQHFNDLLFQIKDARNEILASLEDCHFADLVLKELEKLDDTATIKDPESQVFDEWHLDPF